MSTTRVSRDQLRAQVRPLLDEHSPADALASYYALYCPPERAELFVHADGNNRADGFLVRARTGLDLFRPLVAFRAQTGAAARALFHEGLIPGRPVYLTVPDALAPWANKHLSVTDAELHRIYRLNLNRYSPLINVLTVTSNDPSGGPRCEIRTREQLGAVAGVNWQSPEFAEVYVYTDPAVRGRGWGKSVVSTLVGLILKSGRKPLYVVSENNDYSIRLAEAVGFEDTGHREYVAQAVLIPNP
jgi:ribosomal protein S18 acetylase RimI-like enzyme